MRWLARVFVSAFVRRIAFALAVMLLAALGISQARAADYPTQGAAYAACQSDLSGALAAGGTANESCQQYGNNYSCYVWAPGYPPPNGFTRPCGTYSGSGRGAIYSWPAQQSCSARADTIGNPPMGTHATARSGTIQCNGGCETYWSPNGDGTWTGTTQASGHACVPNDRTMCENFASSGYYWNAYLQACEPPELECAEGQVSDGNGGCKDNECPAGMIISGQGTCVNEKDQCPPGNIKAPSGQCLPGEGQCAAGEAKGKDGTCKRDSNGDGAPDSEEGPDDPEKDSASGGDSCNAPPTCNGNPIMCAQLRTQWRIDCNTRKNRNIAGGHCGPGGVPVCTGDKCDALEYAQLVQTWKASCALENMANSDSPGGGTGSGSDAMDLVSSAGVLGDDLDPASVRRSSGGSWDGEPGEITFNSTGFGFARECPTLPTVSVLGQTLNFDTTVFCDWMRLGGVFVMIMAYLAGLAIIVRS